MRHSVAKLAAQRREGRFRYGETGRHFARCFEHQFGERIELGGTALGLLGDRADIVVADAELAADLDVMGVLVG